jgi:phosphate transport system substrate-binding protein
MHRKPSNPQDQRLALEFFLWAYRNGDAMALELDYVPLSEEEKNRITKDWNIE